MDGLVPTTGKDRNSVRMARASVSGALCHASVLLLLASLFGFPDSSILAYGSRVFVVTALGLYAIRHMRISGYFVWALSFSGFCLASVWWADYQMVALADALKTAQTMIICCLLTAWTDDSYKIRFVLQSVVASAALLAVRVLTAVPVATWGVRRFSYILGLNVNTISIRLTLAIVVAGYLMTNAPRKQLPLYLMFCATASVLVAFLGSRRSILTLAFSLAAFAVFSSKRLTQRLKRVLVASAMVLILGYCLLKIPALWRVVGQRLADLVQNMDSDRVELFARGYELFLARPLWGWGSGNYAYTSGMDRYSHNNYIELLSSVGAIGFVLYYRLHTWLFFRLRGCSSDALASLFRALLLAVLLSDLAAPSYSSLFVHVLISVAVSFLNMKRMQATG